MSAKTPTLLPEDVRRIAALARLELTAAEVELFTVQLGEILGYAADLQAVDTTGVTPTSHALVPRDAWRDDVPSASLPPDAVLGNAPDACDEPALFRVPRVLG